jgi:hypothetical protein
MKKNVSILIVGMLLMTSIGAVALSNSSTPSETNRIVETITISKPIISEIDGFNSISIDEQSSTLMDTGKPMVPVIVETYTFPLGTIIKSCDISTTTQELKLDQKIQPAPQALPLSNQYIVELLTDEQLMDQTIYQSTNLYPTLPYEIQKGAGLENGEHVLIVNVRCYSQYSPANDAIYIPTSIDINILYEPPETPLLTNDEYDMLIITTEEFTDALQPLVDHKNAMGVTTVVDTVENIYASYNGRDGPEDIKLRIKDAIETWGIDYVLLAGGRDGQTHKWLVPSRTTHNDDGWEAGYESDLYYSDIYKIVENVTVFEDWDSDGDGIFAEFGFRGDKMDYYPDVSVGRLPFRSTKEIAPMIQKIIDYETSTDDSWFKKAIVIGGDTFPPARGGDPGFSEAEIEEAHTVALLESIGFTMNKLWLSIPGVWTNKPDVVNAVSQGAGFVHFAGHSNPASWGTYKPNAVDEDGWVDGIAIWDMKQFTNTGEYPVVVLGGCHSAQFNVTMSNIITGILEYGIMGYFFTSPFRFYYYEWVPYDLSSRFVLIPNIGAIGSMGNSGLGYGYVNDDADKGLGGWIEPRFFDAYANQSIDILGPAHDKAISDYISIIGSVNSDQIDRKTIEEWVLIGDPSIKMGGY